MLPKLFSTHGAALVLLALSAGGCGTGYPIGAEHAKPLVLVDAERDLQCPQRDITAEEQFVKALDIVLELLARVGQE